MKLEGMFEKEIFLNSQSGCMAFLMKPADDSCRQHEDADGCIKCIAYMPCPQKYLPLELEGEFTDTGSYGVEFNAQSARICAVSMEDTLMYLEENTQLQKRPIRKILEITGEDIFAAAGKEGIEAEICRKTNVDELDVFSLFDFVRKTLNELDMLALMMNHGGTYEHVLKIMSAYPEMTVEEFKANPYAVLDKVSMKFKILDDVATKNGIQKMSPMRIEAVAYEVVREEKNSGNVYLTLDDISRKAAQLDSDIPKPAVATALQRHPYIVEDPDTGFYYDKAMLKDEKQAAQNFSRLMKSRKDLPWHPEYIGRIEEEQGYKFGDEQRQAFMLLKTTGFKLLTGDPGTGKTSTLKGLLRYLELLWNEEFGKNPVISLCAPSGRAAQRMKETTGRTALTVHKLIEYQPYGDREYYRDASDPLEADVVVVDEASMIGLSIFSKLTSAIKNGAMVLIIGDTNQLQSVDAGDVLHDIIRCGYVDSCHLTETFRQAKSSCININAKKIMQGDADLVEGDDFQIVECGNDDTVNVLTGVVKDLLRETDPKSIQVLAPTRKGTCGVFKGNNIMQKMLNKSTAKGAPRNGFSIKEGDRVIMTVNNYALNYFNGDIGYVRHVGDSSMSVRIGDDDIVVPRANYGDMDLAYFTTVHKAQGSEYDYVVIVMQQEASGMMNRNLFYTAVTRGKKKVIVVAENGMIEKAVKTYRRYSRNTYLTERIDSEVRISTGQKMCA